ncbi:hypothetical protein PIB30_030524 [Stylosanthes scabra]|uniref:Uncharacterized protein n=1 Tax=Stylosanthes scabra TaxID=79078 RepID=A0ABU6Z8E8_9FABA|nr:hypothetical protein [Stylosanthes scabra]
MFDRFLEFEFLEESNRNDEGPNMQLRVASKHSISTPPEELRRQHEDAFRPKVVPIGPLYMATLSHEKRTAVNNLFHSLALSGRVARKKFEKWKKDVISKFFWQLLQSYTQEFAPNTEDELSRILFVDSCVLALPLVCDDQSIHGGDKFWSDIVILGNQMPFFIFHEFCQIILSEQKDKLSSPAMLAKRILRIFSDKTVDASLLLPAHLLELAYISIDDPEPDHVHYADDADKELGRAAQRRQLKRCATNLHAAGIKIIPIQHNRKYFNFGIQFQIQNGTLKIPQLRVIPETEKRWLNFIAWEHSCKTMTKGGGVSANLNTRIRRGICKCTWAALFFNDLICSPSDVQLLRDKQIIIVQEVFDPVTGQRKKSINRELFAFFRSIKTGLDPAIVHGCKFDKIVHDLNKYTSPKSSITRYFMQAPVRIYHYYSGPSDKIIRDTHAFFMKGYNFVLVLVTFLTIVQAVYAVLSYHFPKKSS